MPNLLDSTGLQVKTFEEIRADIITGLKAAYGDDINVDQDTPDGQAIGVFSLAVQDTLDLISQVYSSFDPDQAIGRNLDERCAINGIQRLAGTHTTTSVKITADRIVNLIGLDGSDPSAPPANTFTVSDLEGNLFYLSNSVATINGDIDTLFTAVEIGAIETAPAQITKIITNTLGVKSVTNSTAMNTTLGTNEETDAALRLRRLQAVSLASQGYLTSLKAEIQNISGVTYSEVYENNQSGTVDTIPGHSIWVIADGGLEEDIAYAIYTKRNAGCGMKGSVQVDVTQPDGTLFPIYFDRTSTESIYLKFTAQSVSVPPKTIDTNYLKDEIVNNLNLGVNGPVNANDIAAIVRDIDSTILATDILLSTDNLNWFSIVSPSAKNIRFSLVVGNITITVI